MRIVGLVLAAPLAFALVACGAGDDAAPTPVPTVVASPPASPSPTTAVEQFCQHVDEYARKVQELQASPDPDGEAQLKQKAQELQNTAAQLTEELMDDPTQGTRVQECTSRLQEALAQPTATASSAPPS